MESRGLMSFWCVCFLFFIFILTHFFFSRERKRSSWGRKENIRRRAPRCGIRDEVGGWARLHRGLERFGTGGSHGDCISSLTHLGRTPTAAPPCGATTPFVTANPDIFFFLSSSSRNLTLTLRHPFFIYLFKFDAPHRLGRDDGSGRCAVRLRARVFSQHTLTPKDEEKPFAGALLACVRTAARALESTSSKEKV